MVLLCFFLVRQRLCSELSFFGTTLKIKITRGIFFLSFFAPKVSFCFENGLSWKKQTNKQPKKNKLKTNQKKKTHTDTHRAHLCTKRGIITLENELVD